MTTASEANIDPALPVPELDTPPVPEPAPTPVAPAQTPRNQHLKVEEPKNRQHTGRCTEKEYERIKNACLKSGKQDVVRLCLALLDANEKDWFPNLTTK